MNNHTLFKMIYSFIFKYQCIIEIEIQYGEKKLCFKEKKINNAGYYSFYIFFHFFNTICTLPLSNYPYQNSTFFRILKLN